MKFLLTFSRWEPLSLIDARGDLDRGAAHVLRVGGETELENSLFLVVDLSRVRSIDDHGLCALSALDRLAIVRGGWTRVHNPTPAVLQALEDFELTDMLLASAGGGAPTDVLARSCRRSPEQDEPDSRSGGGKLLGSERLNRHLQRVGTRVALRSGGRGAPEWGPA